MRHAGPRVLDVRREDRTPSRAARLITERDEQLASWAPEPVKWTERTERPGTHRERNDSRVVIPDLWITLWITPVISVAAVTVDEAVGLTNETTASSPAAGLLLVAPLILLGRGGAPSTEACNVTFGDLFRFCRRR